jgi:hypothetical protein
MYNLNPAPESCKRDFPFVCFLRTSAVRNVRSERQVTAPSERIIRFDLAGPKLPVNVISV